MKWNGVSTLLRMSVWTGSVMQIPPRGGHAFDSGEDVDAVAEEIAVSALRVPDVDADP
jgi:hypothetical protein